MLQVWRRDERGNGEDCKYGAGRGGMAKRMEDCINIDDPRIGSRKESGEVQRGDVDASEI